MKKQILFALATLLFGVNSQAQTVEEMTAQKAAKEAQLAPLQAQLAELTGKVDALKGEVADLTEKITPYPRWDVGSLGNIGLNFSTFDNWFSKTTPNTQAVNIGFSMNGFANLQQQKYFWRNSSNLTLGWLKFDDKDNPDDSDEFQVSADAFNVVSLFGWKLTEKWAISTLGEYRTSILDGKFNNPGYFDIGAGATWTPAKDFVVVFHPLNYNFIFADDDAAYTSSLGCKIVADYTRQLTKGIAWKSNLSAFASYQGKELSNVTWVNGFSTAVRGIGIGLDLGFRKNQQEALAAGNAGNPLQIYYLLGLSYAIASKK